ncbi:MAG: cellobiose phosphorylase [Candidatus Omnitrophica bacterium]|nr:cellobiose phosphorylase [Candidatus Omnitrophota bacterium]
MKPKYYLKDDEFVIENYNYAKPFSSFLPGIAGLSGKPLWAFYINRGQCMSSFGTDSKEGAIMEFYPANVAYRRTPIEGFRTFLKIKDNRGRVKLYEPFKVNGTLYVSPHEFRIEDISKEHSIKCEVIYYTIPGEDFPALARELRIENISSKAIDIEVLDGTPKISPFGMNEFFMKHMSRTIEAWMEVVGLKERTPLYRLRVDAADVSETKYIESGNFYLSMVAGRSERPGIIVDPAIIFGDHSNLTIPGKFALPGFKVPADQIDKNITPSAFSHCKLTLAAGRSARILSLMGYADSQAQLKTINRKMSTAFFDNKREINKEEIKRLSGSVSVSSGIKEFDAYVGQTNLDNILRGGYPIVAGGKTTYVFNRKHGDLERDYNHFVLKPVFYSQGNGNYRDTNQNRRLSVWLNPAVATKDIKDFYNLIQLDGYNPLVIKGDIFIVKDAKARKAIIKRYFTKESGRAIDSLLSVEFTINDLAGHAGSLRSRKDIERCFNDIIANSVSHIDAEHGEGFWIDHWTYNLDLVQSYLGVFPERSKDLLFCDTDYRFFDNAHVVKPRKDRIVRQKDKVVRQYRSVHIDEEKKCLIDSRKAEKRWVRTGHGKGSIYTCSLAAKMLIVILNKIASLDRRGIGIEMEADKPGWCDSLNGLPGLFGSSLCETFELLRAIEFLKDSLEDFEGVRLNIPAEAASFLRDLTAALKKDLSGGKHGGNYWEISNDLKESYRARTRLGVSGKESRIRGDEITRFLSLCLEKLQKGIRRGYAKGIPYSYFINDIPGRERALPVFLEAAVHALKVEKSAARARELYKNVRKSALYDKELAMYKLNTPIGGESLEIGRTRVFTPGWLENESIWLHMEYKFLLEVLKAGLYDEFFKDFKSALIPFQPPARYGRSILENSSFIAGSVFFNPELRGNGFVARLSGATAEMLNILLVMNLGAQPFRMKAGSLVFAPEPILDKIFFTSGSYTFNIFQNTSITYNNPNRKKTFGPDSVKPVSYTLRYAKRPKEVVVAAGELPEPFSSDLRSGAIKTISITLG